MHGQFFVISAVIIVSALVLITQYLYDFGRTPLTQLSEMRETDYVRYVQTTLNSTGRGMINQPTGLVDVEMTTTEKFLTAELAERGMQLSAKHSFSGAYIIIEYNLTSPGFFSQTAFSFAYT